MEKRRVYEIAKDLGVDSKRIIDILARFNVEVKNHMSTVEPELVEKISSSVKGPRGSEATGGGQKAGAAQGAGPAASGGAVPGASAARAGVPGAPASAAAGARGGAATAARPAATTTARPAAATAARPAAPAAGNSGRFAVAGQASVAVAPGAKPATERLYNREDLRKQERASRPLPPRPERQFNREDLREKSGTRAAQMLIGGMGPRQGAGHARPGQRPDRSFGDEGRGEFRREGRTNARAEGRATAAKRSAPAAERPPRVPRAEAPAAAARPAPAQPAPSPDVPAATAPEAPPRVGRAKTPERAEKPSVEGARMTESARPTEGARPTDKVEAPRADKIPTAAPAEKAEARPAAGGRPSPAGTFEGGPNGPLERRELERRDDRRERPAGDRPHGPRPAAAGDRAFGPRPAAQGGRSGLPGPRPAGAGFGPGPRPGARPGGPRPGFAGQRLAIPPAPTVAGEQPKQGPRPESRKKADDYRRRGENGRGGRREEGRRLQRPVQQRRPVTQPPKNIKPVTIEGPVTVKDLAMKMAVGAGEVIKKLLALGLLATINQEIDVDTAQIVAQDMGYPVEVKVELTEAQEDAIVDDNEDPELLQPRAPVVTIMGHVDHGKTSLLDAIRETRVAAGEAGGITQHIGAYTVEIHGRKITFLDTPGHEAFTAMRARGAQVTDVAVLVVAADDGVMPQTIEAINHAKAARVPIVVAVNKIDKSNANPDRVKQGLTEFGLVAEEWGGDTIMVPVSAKEKQNLDQLLEMILLVADVREVKANPNKPARGTVIEAELDKGRGPVATVLVQTGTLKPGDAFVAGAAYGKVRAMVDDKGKRVKKAGPSTPVEVLGFAEVPQAGDIFRVVADEKEARDIAERRSARRRREEMDATSRLTLDDLYRKIKEGEVKDLNIIVKADVQGSVEAVRSSLEKLHNEEVRVNVIHGGVGAITESDIMLATASGAIIIGFNVRPDANARRAADEQKVDVRLYRVIYDAVDDVKAALEGMLKPKLQEVIVGRAEIRATFKVPKAGTVAGCYVTEGKITKNASVRLLRDNVVVFEGKIDSLRRFKDDVREVASGFECGIGLEKFNDVKEGDQIEAFAMEEVKPAQVS